MIESPNQRLHSNAAIALQFQTEHYWRGVGEPERSAKGIMASDWNPNAPASVQEVERLREAAPVELPADYVAMLQLYNGGEGELGLPPMWLQLWEIDEVIENLKSDFHRDEFPGYFFFASNGGLELIAIDYSSNPPCIVMIDPIAGPESAECIATDFVAFRKAIGKAYDETQNKRMESNG